MRVHEVLEAWKAEGKPGTWNEFQKAYKLRGATKVADEKALLEALANDVDDDTKPVVELGEFPEETKEDEPKTAPIVEPTTKVKKTETNKAREAKKPLTTTSKTVTSGKKRGRKGSAVKDAQALFHTNYQKLASGELNRTQMIEIMMATGISKNTAIVQYAIQKKFAEGRS